jgi:16S rRNA (guanine527-N7)-methyltransferase
VGSEPPPEVLPAARRLFGDRLPIAARFAELLATVGIERGLLGPREAERVWPRHLLNSAVLAELVPTEARVVDVGSGAGLPGIPLAIARPDLQVVLLEPMLRRCHFLEEAREQLAVPLTVVRGRAPEDVAQLPFLADCAVARAVAPLERLVSWTMPVVRPGGTLLALRGSSAEAEVQAVGPLDRYQATVPEVLRLGAEVLDDEAVVVRVARRPSRRRGSSTHDGPGRSRRT